MSQLPCVGSLILIDWGKTFQEADMFQTSILYGGPGLNSLDLPFMFFLYGKNQQILVSWKQKNGYHQQKGCKQRSKLSYCVFDNIK